MSETIPNETLTPLGLDAVVLITPNLAEQRDFYQFTLGLELVADYGDAVFLNCGTQTIALFGPTHHAEGTNRLDGASKGISHLEFSIPEALRDRWHDHLEASGSVADGHNYQDADGNLFHFNLVEGSTQP